MSSHSRGGVQVGEQGWDRVKNALAELTSNIVQKDSAEASPPAAFSLADAMVPGWRRKAQQLFTAIDTDHDEKLTREEPAPPSSALLSSSPSTLAVMGGALHVRAGESEGSGGVSAPDGHIGRLGGL